MTYTILLQHTVTKRVYGYFLKDLTPESIYHKFRISLDDGMEDGEYEYLLIENPRDADVEVNVNNLFKSKMYSKEVKVIAFGLLTVGDYKDVNTQYDKEQDYVCYEASSGCNLTKKNIVFTENGYYSIDPDEGLDGFSSVKVTIDVPSVVANQDKSETYTENGHYTVLSDTGYSGLGEVLITVDVPQVELGSLDVTSNGTYLTEEGWNEVNVNVPSDVNNHSKVITITENNTTVIEPESQYTGLDKVVITTAVEPTLQSKTVNSSTELQTVSADSNYDGLDEVTINPYTVESKTATYTVNGTYTVSPTNADALSSATITVDVPSTPVVPTQTKSVSYDTNGNYTVTPDSGYNLSSVDISVNVQGGGGLDCVDWSLLGWDCQAVADSGMLDDIDNVENVFLPATTLPAMANNRFSGITYLTYIGVLNTSNTEDIRGIFSGCSNLRGLPPMDCSKINNTNEYEFRGCVNLRYVRGLNNMGLGFLARKCLDFSDCPLTEESVHAILASLARPNNLNGSGHITFSATNYAQVTSAEKSTATGKRWSILSA